MAPPKKKKDQKPAAKPNKNKSSNQLDMMKMIAGDIKSGLSLDEKEDVKFVPARLLSYNRASVLGGFPAGAIYELHGPNGGGKTALGIEILASAQNAGHLTSFHDHERAANDKRWLKALGLDLSNCIYRRQHKEFDKDDEKEVKIWTLEDSAEEINEMIKNFMNAKKKGKIPKEVLLYILFDSVAAAVPSAKVAKNAKVGDANYGLTARLMSDWMQTLESLVGTSEDVAVIFINQERVNVGAKPWEPKFKSFGGEALQFYASVRVRVNQAGEIKEKVNGDEIVVGRKHRFTIEKNKLGYPMQSGYFYTSNGLGDAPLGFDDERSTIEEAIFQGVIEKGGAWYSSNFFNGKINGEKQLRQLLRENPDLHQLIKDEVYQAILSGTAKLTADSDGKSEDDEE